MLNPIFILRQAGRHMLKPSVALSRKTSQRESQVQTYVNTIHDLPCDKKEDLTEGKPSTDIC